jgi:hypothetical protein
MDLSWWEWFFIWIWPHWLIHFFNDIIHHISVSCSKHHFSHDSLSIVDRGSWFSRFLVFTFSILLSLCFNSWWIFFNFLYRLFLCCISFTFLSLTFISSRIIIGLVNSNILEYLFNFF